MAARIGPLPHQRAAATRLRQLLTRGTLPTLCLLTGPTGSGKSWLAVAIAGSLGDGGELGAPEPATIVVQGQHTLQNTPLAIWRLALHGRRSRFARPAAYQEMAQETMRAASKLTLGLSEIVNVALGASKRFRPAPATLNDEQFGILYELAALAGEAGPFVIVADDLQWWDEQSIVVVRALFLPAFAESFPFASRTRVIGVLRSDMERPPGVERLMHDLRPPAVALDLPDVSGSEAALRAFGVRGAERDLAPALHAATGGHLQLLREAAGYVNLNGCIAAAAPASGGCGDWRLLLREWIRERLTTPEVTSEVTRPVEFLEAASTIGVAFTEAALRCLTRDDGTQCERALPVLTALGILERDGSLIRFVHEVLQEATSPQEAPRRRALHERFAHCLRLLSPSDYDARSFYLDRAGRSEEAQSMAVMGTLARIRNGTGSVAIGPSDKAGAASSGAGALLQTATRRWLANEYTAVVGLLEDFPADAPELLAAERAYLVADSLLKSIEAGDRRAVIDLVEAWRGKVDDEFELWFRLSATLMVARSHAGDLGAARAVEREIIAEADKRRRYDPAAVAAAYTLYRKADALHEVEVVARRQQEAVRFFRGDVVTPAPRHPSEYARAAANLVGTLLVLGEYAAAGELADELMAWVSAATAHVPLPRPTVALNNLLLVRLFAGSAAAAEAASAFEELLAAASRAEDRLLIASNLAAVRARAGDLSGALRGLERCDIALGQLYQPDPYYVYFVRSNLVACQFHAGALPDPIAAWRELEGPLAATHEPLRPFLRRRHELQAAAFSEVAPGAIGQWDNYVLARYPRQLGRPWTFYGRGFLLSDIQHWSDG